MTEEDKITKRDIEDEVKKIRDALKRQPASTYHNLHGRFDVSNWKVEGDQ
jgi:uncharacterized protein YeeX (DUF496 family)